MKFVLANIFALVLGLAAPQSASAQDIAGDFDFYVLSLSWSPSYCKIDGSPEEAQCAVERHGFIAHGLWPQYETGYPEYCRNSTNSRVSNATVQRVLDIMPSPGLIHYQWKKHGICAGLHHEDYFDALRQAYEMISIPDDYLDPARHRTLDPDTIERAFLDANPDLSARGMAVTCKQGHLADVRICLTKDLEFRECREVDRRECRSRRIAVPPIR